MAFWVFINSLEERLKFTTKALSRDSDISTSNEVTSKQESEEVKHVLWFFHLKLLLLNCKYLISTQESKL